jgi:hypothetical protein
MTHGVILLSVVMLSFFLVSIPIKTNMLIIIMLSIVAPYAALDDKMI